MGGDALEPPPLFFFFFLLRNTMNPSLASEQATSLYG